MYIHGERENTHTNKYTNDIRNQGYNINKRKYKYKIQENVEIST